MIKTAIINTASSIRSAIVISIGAIFGILFFVFLFLLEGITFPGFQNDTVIIDRVTIKFDKTLQISIKNVIFTPKQEEKGIFPSPPTGLELLVGRIEVDNLFVKSNQGDINATNILYIPLKSLSITNLIAHFSSAKNSSSPPSLLPYSQWVKKITLHHALISFPTLSAQGKTFHITLDKELTDIAIIDLAIHSWGNNKISSSTQIKQFIPFITKGHRFRCENLTFQKNTFRENMHIIINKTVTISHKRFAMVFEPHLRNTEAIFHPFTFQDKHENITLEGITTFYFTPERAQFEGTLHAFGTHAKFMVHTGKHKGSFTLKAGTLPSLNEIVKHYTRSPLLKEWLIDRLQAKSWHLALLYGEFTLHPFHLLSDSLRAQGEITNALLTYNDTLPPLHSPHITLTLTKGKLEALLEKTQAGEITLDNPHIRIIDLFTLPRIGINLTSSYPLNNHVKSLAKEYNVTIPLTQTGGKIATLLEGWYDTHTRSFEYNASLAFHDAIMTYENEALTLRNGTIHANPHHITLNDINITHPLTNDLTLTGKYEKSNRSFEGNVTLSHLKWGQDLFAYVDVQQTLFPIKAHISHDITVLLPSLETTLTSSEKELNATINNFSLYLPFSPFLNRVGVIGGKGEFRAIHSKLLGKGIVNLSPSPLTTPEGISHNVIDFSLEKQKEKIFISLLGQKIEFILNTINSVKAKDVAFRAIYDPKAPSSPLPLPSKPLHIEGENVTLFLNNHPIRADYLSLFHSTQTTEGNLTYKSAKGTFWRNGNTFSLSALGFDSSFYDAFSIYDVLGGGIFNFIAQGNFDDFNGSFTLSNTTVLNMAGFNNLIAFINFAPSLFTLTNPGFNTQGYEVQNAHIDFSFTNGILTLHTIMITGLHTDIRGSGIINVPERSLNLDLRIYTIKSLGKILSSIPVAGHLLLGKDKAFTVDIKVNGSLEKPEITTYTTQGIILSPFNIIKRVFTYPLDIFSKEN